MLQYFGGVDGGAQLLSMSIGDASMTVLNSGDEGVCQRSAQRLGGNGPTGR